MTGSALDEKRELSRRHTEQSASGEGRRSQQIQRRQTVNPSIPDGIMITDLEDDNGHDEAPPAYGELPDQIEFSQPGFAAGANITDDGRVNININTKTRRLADLLAPTLDRQIVVDNEPLPPAYIPPALGGQPGQTPPPQLNVVIQIVGSRGDVQPFVALGKVLRDTYGHRVRIATHATFQPFVEEQGLDFFNIGGDPAELMAFMVKHPGLMPGFNAIKSGEVTKRRKGISDILLGCWRSCFEAGDGLGPAPPPHALGEPLDLSQGHDLDDGKVPFVADAIIANPPSFAHIHIAEKLGIPLHMMFTMPWTPTRAFPHPLADIQFSNADDVMTKYLTYTLVEMMTWQGLGDVINRFREKVLDLSPLSLLWAPGLLNRLRVPYTYCWSPALIPKPNDWGRNVDISGFYFLDLATNYNPDPELSHFLQNGPPPVYIGFGSIVVDDPDAMTKTIFEAVKAAGVRALVSKGWGGIGAEELGVPEGVFMLGNVPHDWLFKKVSCVVHHGGAGTTAAGIKAGKPTVIVPFFGDQPFWGSMIARAKAGSDPIPYKELTADRLSEAITLCLRPETQEKAREYGDKIREEKGTDVGGQSFHSHLAVDTLRCHLAPSRAAAWRVRRSKIRLSPLAAAALIDEGVLDYDDLKLYRAREYNTEDQPPDPISAGAMSLITDIGVMGMSIADMPREMFKSRSRSGTVPERVRSPTPPQTAGSELPGVVPGDSASVSASAAASTTDLPTLISDDSANETAGDPSQVTPPSSDLQRSPQDSLRGTSSALETTASSGSNPRRASGSQVKSAFSHRESSPVNFGVEAAMGAGRSVGRVVTTGVKSPMNFCLGLAKGFRNIPKLYNDETIRPPEKVTGVGSGIKVAGKEFGLGLYDGISGLVTQPLKGAQKGGAAGFVKGFGKGIGGVVTKPAAGVWGIPAYTMKGVHAQVSKLFAKSSQNYIIVARIEQGKRDLRSSSLEERNDIIARWNNDDIDLKSFKRFKKRSGKAPMESTTSLGVTTPEEPTVTDPFVTDPSVANSSDEITQSGWAMARQFTMGRLNDWKRTHTPNRSVSSIVEEQPPSGTALDAEYEQAIQASVQQTSRGNAKEDAEIEIAIRNSVNAVRQRGSLPGPPTYSASSSAYPPEKHSNSSVFTDEELQITDEEYQDLIEQAIRQSMGHYAQNPMGDLTPQPYDSGVFELEAPHVEPSPYAAEDEEHLRKAIEESRNTAFASRAPDDEAELQRVLEESKKTPTALTDDDDDELQKAIAASKDDAEREKNERTEEDIIMEYIKKQSLAEEEFRKQKNKGMDVAGEDGDDEELKRAMEESLKMSKGDESGPSGF